MDNIDNVSSCSSCKFSDEIATVAAAEPAGSGVMFYSTGCPKCKVVELKLKQANIEYQVVSDVDAVVKFGKEHGIGSAPILAVDDIVMDFSQAISYLREIK